MGGWFTPVHTCPSTSGRSGDPLLPAALLVILQMVFHAFAFICCSSSWVGQKNQGARVSIFLTRKVGRVGMMKCPGHPANESTCVLIQTQGFCVSVGGQG